MDKNEKEIKSFKPKLGFTIWLFFYFVSLVTESLRFAKQLSNFGFETYSEPDYSLPFLVFGTLLLALFILYSFKAITLCLSGHPTALSSLRWSLFIFIVYSYGNVFGKIEIINNAIISFYLLFGFFFLVIFWLYTFFSKGIKEMFPKAYRRKFLWGRVGLCFFWTYMAFLGVLMYTRNKIEANSAPINVNYLVLSEEEYADSLTIYKALPGWKYKKRIYETTYFETSKGLDIRVRSNNFPDGSRTMFCAYFGSFLTDNSVKTPLELSYHDTIVDERKVYSSIYKMSRPDSTYYAQVVGIFDKESYKAVMFIVRGDTVPLFTPQVISQICKGVDFRLKDRIVEK